MSSTIGSLLVMLSAAMWRLSGVCGQFLFENYHPGPVWLIAVRQVAAGVLFLLCMGLKGEPLFAIWHSGQKKFFFGLLTHFSDSQRSTNTIVAQCQNRNAPQVHSLQGVENG